MHTWPVPFDNRSKTSPARYEQVGQTIRIDGRWSDANPQVGTVTLDMTDRQFTAKRRDAVDKTEIQTQANIQDGKPLYILGSVDAGDGQDRAKRYIICLTAHRIAEVSAAAGQTK